MAEDHPYQPVVSLLDFVFEPPTDEEMEKMGQVKEDPDLDTMPYPLMYQ
jgi:nitrate reductase delta subunit